MGLFISLGVGYCERTINGTFTQKVNCGQFATFLCDFCAKFCHNHLVSDIAFVLCDGALLCSQCIPETLQVFLNFVKNQNEINRASADGTDASHQGAAASNHGITSPSTTNSKKAGGTTNNTELIAIGGSSCAAENGEDLDDLPIQLKPTEVTWID